MVISDGTIKRLIESDYIGIDPYISGHIQPSSVDLTLGNQFHLVDLDETIIGEEEVSIHPNQFVLGVTKERVRIPYDIIARIEGRSSWGRLGLMVHITAGYIDPGFEGTITLELYNVSRREIILKPGTRICQISFAWMDAPAEIPYGDSRLKSKYQEQLGVTPSRIFEELE